MTRRSVNVLSRLKVLTVLTVGLLLWSGISFPGQPFGPMNKLAQAAAADSSTDLPTPSWWKGECDTTSFRAQTNVDAYPLGGTYRGVKACGPLPGSDNDPEIVVTFPPITPQPNYPAYGEYEWQCVELVMRYMYLAYGIAPYSSP